MSERQVGGRVGTEGQVAVRRLSAADLAKAIEAADEMRVPVLLRASVRYDGKDARASVTAITPHQGRELAATVDVDPKDSRALHEALDGLLDAYAEKAAAEVRKAVAQDVLMSRVRGGQTEWPS